MVLLVVGVVVIGGMPAEAATPPSLQSRRGETPGVDTISFSVRTSDGVDLYSIEADGAKRVFPLGGSYGGTVSLAYAPRLSVDGVISLSGETYLPTRRANPLVSASRLKVPSSSSAPATTAAFRSRAPSRCSAARRQGTSAPPSIRAAGTAGTSSRTHPTRRTPGR
ncbi:MAG: hypothetical protein ACM3QU_03670 [Verrucomicrobiota bacterium]